MSKPELSECVENANRVLNQSVQEALGYVELAKMSEESGLDNKMLRDRAIKALRRFSDDDDLIDALYGVWEDA
jgi:hypothetical protein